MKSDPKQDTIELERLPLEGGSPVRMMPLRREFPGMHHLGEDGGRGTRAEEPVSPAPRAGVCALA
jgi:hypothetical protein